ncbi:MAG: glycosyltransferase family 2 protein, partial [Gaiellaceae bacterium]
LNAFYASRFPHDEVREAEFLMGACLLVRREAADTVGLFDEDFFMFSEETDWCFRFRQAGWKVVFTPDAEFVHVGGASTRQNWNPMFREQVRGHLRFLAKHRGRREAERARKLLQASLRVRGILFPGDRGHTYAETGRWLAGSSLEELLAR